MQKLTIHTDGGARGNPGEAAIGVYIQDEKGKVLAEIKKAIGKTTNNVAEYTAVIEGLLWIKKMLKQVHHDGLSVVEFYLDSTLVAQQLNRVFQIKLPHLKDLALKVWDLESEIHVPISYHVVRREENQEADRLVNEALDGKYVSI